MGDRPGGSVPLPDQIIPDKSGEAPDMSGEILSDGVNVMGAEAASVQPPARENIDEVKARVGDDRAKAAAALDAERSGENRTTLVSWLEGVIKAADDREAQEAEEREEAEAAEREKAEAAAAEAEATRAAAASKPVGDGEDVNPAS